MVQRNAIWFCLPAAIICGVFVHAVPVWAVPTVDTVTKGNWINVYGSSGYILPAFNGPSLGNGVGGGDEVLLPSFVSGYSYTGASGYIWAGSTADVRAPQDPVSLGQRTAATAYDGDWTMTLNISQATEFELGIYGLDWDSTSRVAAISVNSETLVYDNTGGNRYNQGMWGVWTIDAPIGPLTITIDQQAGANSVISAITFDEIQAVPEPAGAGLWSMLGIGAVGFAAVAYRRSNRV